ncbi:MAG: hypothetical protein CL677_07740 [Bdellovibrionaceae bacterium]|nr:hypothetical protein [Pseudobdellovibrionaceae bacterium]|tara:strand:+ start:25436 stop:26566 length:1131 start_codon:yes stop_codon:yes gene_type:complete
MSRLDKMLSDWVANDLISDEQAKKITNHENYKPSHSWVLYGFLILGAATIGIGIISLIAANWNGIPDALKLFVDFALLIALASGSYFAWEKNKPIVFEVLLISFIILCLASIGLISQIYHTGGKLYQALLLWSIITAGVAAASKRSFVPFIWATGFLFGITFAALDSPAFQPIFQKHGSPVAMTIPLISALLAIICRRLGGEGGQTAALRSWTITGGLVALVIAELQLWRHRSIDLGIAAYLPGYVFAALTALGIGMSIDYKKAQKYLLLATLGLYLVPFHFPMFEIQHKISYAFCSVAILATMAVFLASLKHRKLFQIFLVALGIRFLVLYFQALGGLATTGFGLIISGTIIIAMVVVWNRYRKEITTWAEGLVE